MGVVVGNLHPARRQAQGFVRPSSVKGLARQGAAPLKQHAYAGGQGNRGPIAAPAIGRKTQALTRAGDAADGRLADGRSPFSRRIGADGGTGSTLASNWAADPPRAAQSWKLISPARAPCTKQRTGAWEPVTFS